MAKAMQILLIIIMFFVTNIATATDKFKEAQCIQTLKKTCIEQGEKIIDDFPVTKCWKFEERFKCAGQEQNHCDVFETNRGCNQTSAKCIEESETGVCKHFEKQFVCGTKFNEDDETKLITTEFEVTKDEKDIFACSKEEQDKYCNLISEECAEKGETRNIDGKEIFKDCWRWDRRYACRTNTKIDECKELRAKGCIEKSRECIHNQEGRCDHYTVEYECEKNKTDKTYAIQQKSC